METNTNCSKILVMDDNESVRDALEILLETLGFEVHTAEDGQKALDMYKKRMEEGALFDLVMLDLSVRDGWGAQDTIPELIKLDPNVKAVVMSGYSTDPVIKKYDQYGFAGVLKKPFTSEDLNQTIKSLF